MYRALQTAVFLCFVLAVSSQYSEEDAKVYIENLDKESALRRNRAALAEWAYASNITDYNEANRLQVALENARLDKEAWTETIKFDWKGFTNQTLKRMFEKYSVLGSAALSDEKFEQLKRSVSDMQSNYARAKICDFHDKDKCDLSLEPEITEIFAKSEDPEELKHVWVEWHKEAGSKVKNFFIDYVRLSNEAARENGFTDNANNWLSKYEQEGFEDEMGDIWNKLMPLYKQVHAYVRQKLNEKYGDSVVSKRGPIPAHLLGNVWAQSWTNLEHFSRPYPDKPDTDITQNMIDQGYNAIEIFNKSDLFFQSLGMPAMPEKFWTNSILEKPDDGRDLICHASAWDFFDGEDFRVKQCTEVNSNHFETAHHEMGHVQYYLHYKNLPAVFKGGANPGFHEAVGDVISLSVSTPKHLNLIGLLGEISDDEESEINHLYSKAIEKIVFLPFAYLLDRYRYGIFRGQITPDNYNCEFWKLRESLQGLEPPVERSEDDFDAAAKYHISADVEYARYYVSFIIQFQFHISLCKKAGEYVPGDDNKKLINCDIYNSAEAGKAMSDMLSLGMSKPWHDAMQQITGERNMNADGILEYFKPLQEWLERHNQETGAFIGWEESKIKYCSGQGLAMSNAILMVAAVSIALRKLF